MWPFRHACLELETSLRPEECERELRLRLAPLFSLRSHRGQPLVGHVSRNRFALTRSIPYRNPFQTQTRGTFQATHRGTRLKACFGLAPWVEVSCLVYFVFIGFVIAGVAVEALRQPGMSVADSVVALGVALASLLGGPGAFWVGRRVAASEGAYLRDFLQQTLRAEARPDE